jgi:RNA polymerase sigma-70 factor (ECF subfamily)
LFFLEDLSVEEVATVLGVPPGTVKSRLHYAKRTLRKVITEGASGHE